MFLITLLEHYALLFLKRFQRDVYFGSQNVLLKGRITFSKNILNIFGDNFLKMYERIETMNRTYKNEFMHANIHSHALIITLRYVGPQYS